MPRIQSRANRILMTADTVGGVWTYSLELAKALVAHDCKIALATMGRALLPDQRRDLELIPGIDIFESEYKLEWMQDPWDDVAAASDWLLGIAAKWQPNLIHLNGYTHAALPWNRPVVVVAHSCVASWWKAVLNQPMPHDWDRYLISVQQGLHAADVVVAPSHAFLRSLFDNYGPFSNARVIHNGLLDQPVQHLPPKEKIIFAAGRVWDQAKNIQALSQIAPALKWPVYIAGDDQLNGRAAVHLNLHSLGRLPRRFIRDWMHRAAIYAFPARYEPFGLSILEAAQSGCALVLGDIPTLREIWDGAAEFVPPEKPEVLSELLNYLSAHPARVRDLGRRARRAARTYTTKRMCDAYLAAYNDAAARCSLKVIHGLHSNTTHEHIDGPVPIKVERVSCES